jgi:hypothetical protein
MLLSVAAGPEPSKLVAAVPYPTKSLIAELGKQLPGEPPQLSNVVFVTSATFPLVALIGMFPVASGAGRSAVPPAPAASCTR